MKYLALVDSLHLDTLYNIFIPDMRNSGESDPATTYMGYKFAEDIASSILMLSEKKNQKRFTVYGFSMGAMASMTLVGRPDLQELLGQHQLSVEKLILDSPLSNVQETLWLEAKKMGLPKFLFDITFSKFDELVNGYGENLCISKNLEKFEKPVLILQSEDDTTTPLDIFKSEIDRLSSSPNIRVIYFQGPDHVRMWQDERTQLKYMATCKAFFYQN
jgi:pimeloyl-ACP methyl ester carboxylesterase